MKKHILFGAIAGMLFLSSCDEVDNPVIDYGSYRNDLYGPPPTFTPLAAAEQRVLLEDFTGHDCGNCPAAHQIAKEISETHGDHVAVVAVHAGSLAEPFGQFPADWRTPEGEYYLLTQIGSDLLPTGRVNRVGGAGNELAPPTWSTNTDAELSSSAPVDLQIASSYDLTNQHLNVHVNTQWFESLTGNYKLVILVTQDSIVAPQLNYAADPEYIPEYVHRHMLRTSISGATGLTVADNPTSGSSTTSSFTYPWDAEWVPEHMEIVAFVTAGDNGEVLNVAHHKLVE